MVGGGEMSIASKDKTLLTLQIYQALVSFATISILYRVALSETMFSILYFETSWRLYILK